MNLPAGMPPTLLRRELEGRPRARDLLAGRELVVHTCGAGWVPGTGEGAEGVYRVFRWLDTAGAGIREWSLECGPRLVEASRVRRWRDAGISRISLTAPDPEAVARIRDAGMACVSVEIPMRDRSTTSLAELLSVLPEAGATEVVLRGEELPDGSDEVVDLHHWRVAREHLDLLGFRPLEPWRFQLPEHRCEYARFIRLRRPLVGLGPGAISFRNPMRRWNVPNEADWAGRLRSGMPVDTRTEHQRPGERRVERLWGALSGSEGLRVPASLRSGEALRKTGLPLGTLQARGRRLLPTWAGWEALDELVVALLRCADSMDVAGTRGARGGRLRGPT